MEFGLCDQSLDPGRMESQSLRGWFLSFDLLRSGVSRVVLAVSVDLWLFLPAVKMADRGRCRHISNPCQKAEVIRAERKIKA